jgi:hypothetical protein
MMIAGGILVALLRAASADLVCDPTKNNPASDLNGGPTMMATADPALCRKMCEDHELCGAFVFHPRANGCLPVNVNTNHSKTNLPPDWPAAQCFLKAPAAANTKLVTDPKGCSCAGVPRQVCGESKPHSCDELCPSSIPHSNAVKCMRRRGFSLPVADSSTTPTAAACAIACSKQDACAAWSWTSCSAGTGQCSLKNLVGVPESDHSGLDAGSTFSCTATKRFEEANETVIAAGNFTPFGFLQNPYHRVRHHSGMIRVHDRLNGLSMYSGSSAPHDPLAAAASATLFVAVPTSKGAVLITASDFDGAGVERVSPLHTMNRLSIQHSHAAEGIEMITSYYQVNENSISARVRVRSTSSANQSNAETNLSIVVQLDTGQSSRLPSAPAPSNTYTARASQVVSTMVLMQAAGGPAPSEWAVALAASAQDGPRLSSANFFDSEQALRSGLSSSHPSPSMTNFSTASSLLFMSANLQLQGGEDVEIHVVLSRSAAQPCNGGASKGCPSPSTPSLSIAGTNALAAINENELSNQWNRSTSEDNHFWGSAMKLEGSWPDTWKRGVQYDFGTVRANIRPAVGVFKHPWDAMQVHGPRVVVAETSMDTM